MRSSWFIIVGLCAAGIIAGCATDVGTLIGADSGTNNLNDVVVAADMGAPIDNGPQPACNAELNATQVCACLGLGPVGVQTCSDGRWSNCECPTVDAGTPVDNGPVQPVCSPPCGLTQTCSADNVCTSNCPRPCVGRETCVLTGENGWSCIDLNPPPVDAGTPDVPADAPATCPTGSASCDGTMANGCEVNTAVDENNCGSCGNVCRPSANSVGICFSGRCDNACNAGFGNCNATPGDGCETDMRTSLTSCGACGNACPTRDNAATTCSSGACGFTCLAGYADCDRNPFNGCEVNVRTSESSCGTCGNACGVGSVCSNGVCQFACNAGDGGVPLTSCPGGATCISLSNDLANCGACGRVCPANVQAHATCANGACGNACNTGFGDCDHLVANGCERELVSDPANCGRCGNACPTRPNAATTCVTSWCGYTCSAGFGDCDYNSFNGCETDTRSNTLNCGGCGRACPSGQSCAEGRCVGPINPTCPPGQTNCGWSVSSPICINLAVDRANCGACGYGCFNSEVCASGGCNRCPSGQVACNNVCTDIRSSAANCGGCGVVCGSGQACVSGVCTTPCASGQVTCGGACTSVQTDTNNCGACGTICPARPNANGTTCMGGSCGYTTCISGFGDCTGGTADGCETVLNTNLNCGACGRVCGSGTTCSGGTCVTVTPVDAGTPTDTGTPTDVMTAPVSCPPGFSPRTIEYRIPATVPAGCGGSSARPVFWGQVMGEPISTGPGTVIEPVGMPVVPLYHAPLPGAGAPLTPLPLSFTNTAHWGPGNYFDMSARCGDRFGTYYESLGFWLPYANLAAAGGSFRVNGVEMASEVVRVGNKMRYILGPSCVPN